jgi:hypothetical protein
MEVVTSRMEQSSHPSCTQMGLGRSTAAPPPAVASQAQRVPPLSTATAQRAPSLAAAAAKPQPPQHGR